MLPNKNTKLGYYVFEHGIIQRKRFKSEKKDNDISFQQIQTLKLCNTWFVKTEIYSPTSQGHEHGRCGFLRSEKRAFLRVNDFSKKV